LILIRKYHSNRIEEAQKLTRLCLNIFPDNVINAIKGGQEEFISNNPENKAALPFLR